MQLLEWAGWNCIRLFNVQDMAGRYNCSFFRTAKVWFRLVHQLVSTQCMIDLSLTVQELVRRVDDLVVMVQPMVSTVGDLIGTVQVTQLVSLAQ